MVLRRPYRLADEQSVLWDSTPGDAGRLARPDGRQSLVAAEQGLEVQVVVCAIGAAGKVGGGGGNDASVLAVGWGEGI